MAENRNPDIYRFPVLTLLLVTGSLLIFLLPGVSDYFLYKRDQILTGELWRLVTGAGVHFSWSHLGYNIAIMLIAGWLLERENRANFVWLVLTTSIISGLYFLLFCPEMKVYGGLSAVVSAVVVYLCLVNIIKIPEAKWLWITILIMFTAKVIYEGVMQQTFFVSYSSLNIRVVPSAHIVGAIVAITMVIKIFIEQKIKK